MTLLAFALGGVVAYLLRDWLGRVVTWRRQRLLLASATTVSVGLYTAFLPLLVFIPMYFAIRPLGQLRSALGLPVGGAELWAGSVTEGQVTVVLAAAIWRQTRHAASRCRAVRNGRCSTSTPPRNCAPGPVC